MEPQFEAMAREGDDRASPPTPLADPVLVGAATVVGALAACKKSSTGPMPPPVTIAGTWTGTATMGGEALGLRFSLVQEAASPESAALSGRVLFREPRSGEYLDVGAISGSRRGATAEWALEGGGTVAGVFHGKDFNQFRGTLTFAPEKGSPPMTAAVELTR